MHSLRSHMLLGILGALRSLLPLLALVLAAGSAVVQQPADATLPWRALIYVAMEADRRGAFGEGVVAAGPGRPCAAALARAALGGRRQTIEW